MNFEIEVLLKQLTAVVSVNRLKEMFNRTVFLPGFIIEALKLKMKRYLRVVERESNMIINELLRKRFWTNI